MLRLYGLVWRVVSFKMQRPDVSRETVLTVAFIIFGLAVYADD